MKRLHKTMRRKRFRKQRSRRHGRRHTRRFSPEAKNVSGRKASGLSIRRHRGGGLPVPAGALVGISTGGEHGVPLLMSKEQYEREKESGSLED